MKSELRFLSTDWFESEEEEEGEGEEKERFVVPLIHAFIG